ncbi:MAG: c-type cytochrome [Silvanigrellaceae bacterium]
MKKVEKNRFVLSPREHLFPACLAVSLVSGSALLIVASACSNSININPQSSNSAGKSKTSKTSAAFDVLPNVTVPSNGEVLGLSFTDKNKALFLLDNGSSLALDLGSENPTLSNLTAPADFSVPETKLYPVTEADCWAVGQKEIKLRFQKDPSSVAVLGANVNFASEPVVVTASSRALLLKVGNTYKLLRAAGRLEILFDGPLDFQGKTAPMPSILGAGLIGEIGFWVSDGDRRVAFLIKNVGQLPVIVADKISVSHQGSSQVGFNVVESNSAIGFLGSAVAYRKSDRAVLKSENLGDGFTSEPAAPGSGDIPDAEVLQLVTTNCAGCHGPGATNGFQDATKEASWKSSAAQLKEKLEANAMPPGGGQLSLRQSLAAYLTKISGLTVNVGTTATPTPTATAAPDPKLAEFNSTYKTLIQNSCVNGCHTHGFHLGNEATYERVKANKTAMKTRLDNNSMPRTPVTITTQQRTMLSNWLGSLP